MQQRARTQSAPACANTTSRRRTPSGMLDALSSLFISDKNKAEEKADELFRRYSIDTNKKYGEGGYGATHPCC